MAARRTRRERNAEATRRDILAAGREIFSRQAYSKATITQICYRAGVTRGVLQHQFRSKLGLFVAVFDSLQHDASVQITEAIDRHQDPWERARAATAAFLDACTQPAYQTVVLKEGPAAMGWDRWRERDAHCYADLVRALVDTLAPAGQQEHLFASLTAAMRGTLTELSFQIAQSSDQALARYHALLVVRCLLNSLRAIPPDGDTPEPIRVGIGQLRAGASGYLDRVAAGETIDVLRRGRVVASLQSAR
ncbi:hypothetical protein BST11_09600 [Mycobacterium alsense]|uniref:TetR family transcriptional regulator n=1 Tax=Mycobacterium alsense TaxID=324058 RepID=A0AA42BZK7_9MYCO|nr:TetR family transcriptional regulator [Mycobacterium alsense]MCV7379872.1 TetR family transcriptional regulator [Mycobacterium alsense]OQZ91093.1 hypothetical protein BST11_09600 [Mycobacterium alsense]